MDIPRGLDEGFEMITRDVVDFSTYDICSTLPQMSQHRIPDDSPDSSSEHVLFSIMIHVKSCINNAFCVLPKSDSTKVTQQRVRRTTVEFAQDCKIFAAPTTTNNGKQCYVAN